MKQCSNSVGQQYTPNTLSRHAVCLHTRGRLQKTSLAQARLFRHVCLHTPRLAKRRVQVVPMANANATAALSLCILMLVTNMTVKE